jgi:uncharacterized protein YqjF (DUF2071 family)
MSKVFLSAKWLNLIMVNYEIDPAILNKHIPAFTELDSYNGIHYASLVGFLFRDTKLKGISVPFHRTFEEINLRFYVRQKDNGKWKRGVVFLKEIVSLPAISMMANLLYKEHYETHRTKHLWNMNNEEWQIEYHWKLKNDWNWLKVSADASSYLIEAGSEEEFIAIQNWGYSYISGEKSGIYEVDHPNWRIHPVKHYEVKCDVEKMYGKEFENPLSVKPRSVFLAEGSDIAVMHKNILKASTVNIK